MIENFPPHTVHRRAFKHGLNSVAGLPHAPAEHSGGWGWISSGC
jgi:hypothetical protein